MIIAKLIFVIAAICIIVLSHKKKHKLVKLWTISLFALESMYYFYNGYIVSGFYILLFGIFILLSMIVGEITKD